MEKKRIIGIYLAAGNSRRFGKRKTEQLIWRRPLASIALSTILKSEIDFTIAICSAADKLNWITPEIHETYLEKWRKVVCTSFELSYSLQLGLHAARNTGADAVIIFLADQPFVSSKLIDKIIAVYRESVLQEKQVEFITASYQGKPRPPVLFSNEMFSPLKKSTVILGRGK
ncbi:NTP transferase domain-containing protein [Virgibacillus sp. 179-BFC.A HS]|uniref:NTP transferase domain-containing protein n=1 Tax=Tigheibacillus jepli TaxID=3035914 RepID=A0ABU5CH74_9BACI|nr:NTP transferase domain-containing protein [Virgibacillus sp. 179-BFC.A HS]MDY0405660.1 NTP transferase domain-containing protein [Virgibacillus sp. 179-BFC.A HS]